MRSTRSVQSGAARSLSSVVVVVIVLRFLFSLLFLSPSLDTDFLGSVKSGGGGGFVCL